LTGYGTVNVVTFTYKPTSSDQTEAWDLDGDGAFDDHFGASASWTYPARGIVKIGLEVTDSSGGSTKVSTGFMQLAVNGPSTTFHVFPETPTAGQQVTFAYSPVDPVDPSSGLRWDLNGDGIFDDFAGATAFKAFAVPGTYPVSLRVTDQTTGAVSTGTQPIRVAPAPTTTKAAGRRPQFRLMSPFPIVRITGKVSQKGATIKRLTIRAPFGSTVVITCRGHGCPFRRSRRTLALAGARRPSKMIRVKKLERRLLRAGASLKVLVFRAGEIGKYTKFKIRTGKTPLRTDLCLTPGSTAPKECPIS
jgi:PKD repeat protein